MGKEEIPMADYEKLYEERKKRVETAVLNQEPDRVPNTLLVGTYPLHKAGITMAESMVDHEKASMARQAFSCWLFMKNTLTQIREASVISPPQLKFWKIWA